MEHAIIIPRAHGEQWCLEHCVECRQVCQETAQYCLDRGGAYAEPEHLRLLFDCIEICRTGADFLTRQSTRHGLLCAACAIVCDACAESCDRFGDDYLMKQCADVCRRCAQSCREMVG